MAKNFLLEIGLEEMPAHVVFPSMQQLKEKTEKFLAEKHLAYDEIKSYSTPRRLALFITNLVEKQADIHEEVKGPAKKIAIDAEGNWTKAAQGFVRGQGLTTDDITFKELKGVEYVYVTKHTAGKKTTEVLQELPSVITSLTFPVTMHWNKYDFEYIRPIHWLVALYGSEVVPFTILDVTTDRFSRGHRFLGQKTSFEQADDYLVNLEKEFVIADQVKRQAMIEEQIAQIAKENNYQVSLDPELLEEVVNLVEYPTAFVGNFDPKYLAVPQEVLITSMKEHQRYFEVKDQQGNLLPHFISVRNGNQEHLANVIKGNQKVLTARLEDAEFFYAEDQKLTIDFCVNKLKNVAFHEKIGSLYQKMQRVTVIAELFGQQIGLSAEELADLNRASQIYKFDLVTNMVGEFPELQGIMGEKYALLQGEKASVAKAIREHYLPIASEGDLPASKIGAVLAIADKLDAVLTFFAAGMIPSGSNDPYALRRQAYGIVRILLDQQWSFAIRTLIQAIAAKLNEQVAEFGFSLDNITEEVTEFFAARLKQALSLAEIRYDIIDASLYSNQEDLLLQAKAAQLLQAHSQADSFKPAMEALTRVVNLAKKADQSVEIDESLFETEIEREFAEKVQTTLAGLSLDNLAANYEALVALEPVIVKYFEETMIMADNEAVRNNRLSLLKQLATEVEKIAKLDVLITK
ncbi:glycine--tRNA ligase subunit beta [Enterococcus columbae]|uniref:Glycine--tRNA ligase beta subunit n=1 Tax=Enterococcus columbae DSM 7374 = ATCC 51263 TaxID=1121865 RepID=S1NW17_9ENTE|nr:glycine--tRNA ligase subunit beta [Enterococcus columbae]EOT44183.1 glycine-tRNA ligase, beta subunit [Enterococcus columbae DSM 7374 = ATCC 51263]EOW84341.1 glycine-tRNA ligase, beta subunit [Enterococcus columbae DSM 7374 = ATCC 51263]OJG26101.1 glycine-tRNA ligase, beta subunit [Enterococcus columbae DSM 7374 = ATCC 51263]